MISKVEPLFWDYLSHEVQDCIGKVFSRWIMPIMGDVLVHDGPEPLDGIEMGAIGRQLDQMNAAVFARQERSDIGAFVVRGVVPDDMDDALVGVVRLDFGQQLRGAEPSTVVGSTKGASKVSRFRAP